MRGNCIFAFLWLKCTKSYADSCPILRTLKKVAVGFGARFLYQGLRVLNLYDTTITTVLNKV
jgi:hypothetical protein